MKTLVQQLKSGRPCTLDVPNPVMTPGSVLVQNLYSVISAGTEGSTVRTARKGVLGKAKERPQQVKQVIDTLKSQGPVQTYRAVQKKLEAYSPLGYSCVGRVIEASSSMPNAQSIKQGQWVACGGLDACHAEVVCVPENLCVILKPDTDLKQAAYNTLGAIALQGVRQADLRLGETCAVIGLGLLGQLTCLLLKASGVRVAGIDIDAGMVEVAKDHCAHLALVRSQEGLKEKIEEFASGIGCDAVIITAATDSLDPINFAGSIARKKGTVVVVGSVPTGFDREPYYYKKELQIRMSCSYGPGRYDPQYEEKGIDYPPAYVRWTEKRNMEAFQELIYTGRVDVSYLTTHTFKIEEAPKAYNMMMAKSEPFIGILLEYDNDKTENNLPIFVESMEGRSGRSKASFFNKNTHHLQPADNAANGQGSQAARIGIGFIGAGSYAQSHLLPNIPKTNHAVLKGVMTSSGTSSRSVAERFGFEFCAGDEKDIIENPGINTIFIATRHDSHAGYVQKALEAGKNVFVEKPLCLSMQQLNEIVEISTKTPFNNSNINPILMVGYNRRFSPFALMIKDIVLSGPVAMNYRINAGTIPGESWIQDPEIGGGRIIGEVCHFVDFMTYICGSLPVTVYANAVNAHSVHNDLNASGDTLTISIQYKNGSIGTISYFAIGDKSLAKERVEVYAHGCTAIIDDFKTLMIHANGKKKAKKLFGQDKGQKNEVRAFLNAIQEHKSPPIAYDELFSTSWVTFKIIESIHTGQSVELYKNSVGKL